MHITKRYILTICLLLLSFLGISAQEEVMHDSLRASLVTCTPGTEVYAHFGHTAIRITDFTTGKDVVFNYGCFDMTGSDFIIHFIKGETDYVVDVENANFFFYRYDMMGNGVTEQVLNLTQEECSRLFHLLIENIKPENRGYRYNWLYDNCTTRARDIINKAVDGTIAYSNDYAPLTARSQLHKCLANNSWLKLGIDLMLGTEIDTIAPRNIIQFIPENYRHDISHAVIISSDGSKRPFIQEEILLLEEKDINKAGDTPLTPEIAFSLLLLVAAGISIKDYRQKKISYWFDALLHLAQGIAGIIIAYLFFFSIHPAVSTNWQVIIFNPLFILYAAYMIYIHVKKKEDKLTNVNTAVICIFFVVTLIAKQDINLSVWIMALILCVRNLTRYHILLKNKFLKNK